MRLIDADALLRNITATFNNRHPALPHDITQEEIESTINATPTIPTITRVGGVTVCTFCKSVVRIKYDDNEWKGGVA